MSSQLQAYMERLKTFLNTLVQKIEESSAWERLSNKVESLDPTQRRQLRTAALVVGLAIPGALLIYPLWMVAAQKSHHSALRDLVDDMKEFNEERAVEKRPAPAPGGFQNLPISSAAEAEDSLGQYMSQIGITPEVVELKTQGDDITVDIKELSVKQLVALNYQMDAWHPAFLSESVRVGINSGDKTLLTMQARYKYVAANAGKVGQGTPRASFDDGDEPGDFGGGGGGESAPSGGSPSGGGGGSGGDFGGDGGFDDYAPPPDMGSDDFGDLPPPPSFEEDL